MKVILRVTGVLLVLGVLLALIGVAMGAKMGIYWDESGVHAWGSDNADRPISISEVDLVPFTDISLEIINHDIEFLASEYYGFELVNNNDTEVAWSLQNGKLTITEKSRGKFGINLNFFRELFKSGSYIKIYLPADAVLGDVSVENVSGAVVVSALTCSSLSINTVSGRADIDGAIADKLTIESVSGGLALRDCRAESVTISIVSGRSSISGIQSNGLHLDSISGRVEIGGDLLGQSEISSVSGSILLQIVGKSENYNKNFNLVSGNLRINGLGFSKDYSEKNGAPNSLKIDTISGSVTVYFAQ